MIDRHVAVGGILREVSVIIPFAPQEIDFHSLLQELNGYGVAEVLLVVPMEATQLREQLRFFVADEQSKMRLVDSLRKGRAEQLNLGARKAKGRFLWFIHADTRLAANTVSALVSSLGKEPDTLWFFNLRFFSKYKWAMKLNEVGVFFRSHLLAMPFGDQAFCLARDIFFELGEFDVGAPYGEDHLLVWRAKRRGIAVLCTGASVFSSARKYEAQGWIKITAKHIKMTYLQAWPEFLLWLRGK